MPDVMQISVTDCNAYELAYWSTRAFGCLQSGWVINDDNRIAELVDASEKIQQILQQFNPDGGGSGDYRWDKYVGTSDIYKNVYPNLIHYLEHIPHVCRTARNKKNHLCLLTLWRSIEHVAKSNEDSGYGQLVVQTLEYHLSDHEVRKEPKKKIVSEVEKTLKGIKDFLPEDTAFKTYREQIATVLKQEKVGADIVQDWGDVLSHIERICKIKRRNLCKYETVPKKIRQLKCDYKNNQLPSPMVDLLTSVEIYNDVKEIWDFALAYGRYLAILNNPDAQKLDDTGIKWKEKNQPLVSYWFDLGRCLALLIDNPSFPDTVRIDYFKEITDHTDVHLNAAQNTKNLSWERYDRESILHRSKENARNLLAEIPDSNDMDAENWARALHGQVEEQIDRYRRIHVRSDKTLTVQFDDSDCCVFLNFTCGEDNSNSYTLNLPNTNGKGIAYRIFKKLILQLEKDFNENEGVDKCEAGKVSYEELFGEQTAKLAKKHRTRVNELKKELNKIPLDDNGEKFIELPRAKKQHYCLKGAVVTDNPRWNIAVK